MTQERAVLAGGCFWGMQDLIRRQNGVISTRVGYTGGDVPNATYRNHGTHAEAIEIVFDPAKTSYRRLLEFFFPDPRSDHEKPAGQRHRDKLSLGDLLHERGTEARRRGYDRRRRCLRSLAWKCRHRDRARRRFLGSRTRAPRLFGTLPGRLHLSLHPPGLEAPRTG